MKVWAGVGPEGIHAQRGKHAKLVTPKASSVKALCLVALNEIPDIDGLRDEAEGAAPSSFAVV
jgi:hypothetical protein